MLDILFSHSYYYPLDKKQWDNKTPYPPLGTMYAAALMRKEGYSVDLFDTNLRVDPYAIESRIKEQKPKFLVIYDDGFNYLTKMCLTNMREAAFDMIKIAKSLNITVICSSSDATDQYEKYIEKGADIVIQGEGEITLHETISAIKNEKSLTNVDGIVFKEDEKIIKNKARIVLKDLDQFLLYF